MKKTILIVTALLMVFSSVAAVSAYEAHVVDVRAHVENAIWVEKVEMDFGVTFPQEAKETDTWIGLSESFQGQEFYSSVLYELWWEDKSIYDPDPNNPALDPDEDLLYEPIYPYITLTVDGQTLPPIDPLRITAAAPAVPIGIGSLTTSGDMYDNIHLVFDPPVFDLWYNDLTDPRTPSGILVYADLDYDIVDETFDDVPNSGPITVGVPHADLGNILKIQVYDIVPHSQ